MSDMRSIKIALEAYCVDESDYPYSDYAVDYRDRLICITTPIAYISTIPFDVFAEIAAQNPGVWPEWDERNDGGYDYWTHWAAWDYAEPHVNTDDPWNFPDSDIPTFKYQLRSLGPDQDYDGDNTVGSTIPPSSYMGLVMPYDPTNGTISDGDIYTWGPGGTYGWEGF
jgi:hypothetical protein